MKPDCIITDIYKTVLEVTPPPPDADARWTRLLIDTFENPEPIGLGALSERTAGIIAREHGAARAAGVPYPEIYWPTVMKQALPGLSQLGAPELSEFLFRHSRLQRTVGPMPEAVSTLADLKQRGMLLGIASNSQPYTLRELADAFRTAHAAADPNAAPWNSADFFHQDLCFYSFAAGFSKPDPHVFRWLAARVRGLGIDPARTLVVGDRMDNDIVPAKHQGFATWHFLPQGGDGKSSGNWAQLARRCR